MATYFVTTSGDDGNDGLSEGNAFLTWGFAASQATSSGDLVHVKAGTYVQTSITTNIAGGVPVIATGVIWEGYSSTPGDEPAWGSMPVLDAGVLTAYFMVRFSTGSHTNLNHAANFLEVDGKGNSTVDGFKIDGSYNDHCYKCLARNCRTGYDGSTGNRVYDCVAISCSTYGFSATQAFRCIADACARGFYKANLWSGCLAANSTLYGFDWGNNTGASAVQCISYNATNDGFKADFDIHALVDCIAVANGAYGYDIGGSTSSPRLFRCADYNNTSGRTPNNNAVDIDDPNLTGDPFTDAANDDFTLNNTSGAGAALRAVGFTDYWGNIDYSDIGPYQHEDAGGGGLAFINTRRNSMIGR